MGLLLYVLWVASTFVGTFSGDGGIVLDWRVPGVAAGGLGLVRDVPLVPAMVVAALVTALLRLIA